MAGREDQWDRGAPAPRACSAAAAAALRARAPLRARSHHTAPARPSKLLRFDAAARMPLGLPASSRPLTPVPLHLRPSFLSPAGTFLCTPRAATCATTCHCSCASLTMTSCCQVGAGRACAAAAKAGAAAASPGRVPRAAQPQSSRNKRRALSTQPDAAAARTPPACLVCPRLEPLCAVHHRRGEQGPQEVKVLG